MKSSKPRKQLYPGIQPPTANKPEKHRAGPQGRVQNQLQRCVFNIKLTMLASNEMFIHESYLSYKEQQRGVVTQRCTLGVTGAEVHAESCCERKEENMILKSRGSDPYALRGAAAWL